MYSQELIDRMAVLRHKRIPDSINIKGFWTSQGCNDSAVLGVWVVDGRIQDIGFMCKGCALSSVSCDLLCEHVRGMGILEAKEFAALFIKCLREGIELPDSLKCLADVRDMPHRVNCVIGIWTYFINLFSQES